MARTTATWKRMTAAAIGSMIVLAPATAVFGQDNTFQLAETRPAPLGLFGSRNANRQQGADAVRLDNLEAQLRRLNGQVEELTHRLQQMQDQMQRMQGDMEYRLQELESGKGRRGDASPPSVPSTNVAPTAQSDFSATPQSSDSTQLLGTVPADDLAANGDDPIGRAIGQPLDLSALARGQQSFDGTQQQQSFDGGFQDQQFASVQPTSPRDAYDIAYGHILRGEYDRAETSFRDFLAQYPSDALAPSAKYWLGESLYSRGEYSDASQQFLALYTDFPNSEKAPDALLKLGQSLAQLGETGTACATYGEMLKKYPNAARSVRSRAQSEMRKSGC